MSEEKPSKGIVEEFREDLHECWHAFPNKGLFFVLLGAWLVLFHFYGNATLGYTNRPSLMGWMYNAYNSGTGDDGHGNLIPFVVLGLFWWKRKELIALPLRTWWPALLILAFSATLHIVGYLVQQPRISIVALFGGIYGLMGLAWGWRFLLAGFFPFFLFAFCVPFGSQAEVVTFPLRLLVTWLSVGLSHTVLGIEVMREGSLIFDSAHRFQYDVAPACSGIRSLVSLLALTTIYGFVSFKALWKRLVMMAVAFPLAVLGNTIRITCTIVVADVFGQQWGSWFETKFGFVTFAVAIVCVLLIGRWLKEKQKQEPGLPVPASAS